MLTSDERLALLSVIDKVIQPQLKAEKDNARVHLMELAEKEGADRRAIKVDGQKVGDVTIAYAQAHPVIIDEAAAMPFLIEHGLVETVPVKGWEEHFQAIGDQVVYKETGELVDGFQWEPQRPKIATVKIKNKQDVLNAFGNRLLDQDLGTLLTSPNSLLMEGSHE